MSPDQEVSAVKRRALALPVACLAVLLAACGSTTGVSSSNTDSGPAIALPTPSAPANGKPLQVFYFNEEGASAAASSPESYQAAEAAVDYINKNLGGVKGRPFQLIHCASLGTPDSVTNCANKAVDAKPDVVVNGTDTASAAAVPILAGANIPFINLNTGDPAALTDPNTFVLTAGNAPLLAGPIAYAKEQGYKNVGVIYTNVTSLTTAVDSVVSKFAAREGINLTTVPVPVTTGDLTPAYSSLLAKKVDAIEVVTSTGQCAAALKARQSLADTHPLFMSTPCSGSLTTVPSTVSDKTIILTADTSAVATNKDTQIYRSAMKTYQPGAETKNFAPLGFASIMDLYNALETTTDPASLDAASVKKTLQTAKQVPLFLAGDTTFTCGQHLFTNAPSACMGSVFLVKYDAGSGTFTLTKSYDMAQPLNGIA
jgi:branched-chain amino acid transport system substrate-binding protein